MSRYNVGETLYTIAFSDQDNKTIWGGIPHLFRVDKDVKFKIVELLVTEHHKVPDHWTPDGEKNNDGFILVDKDSSQWYNQYPTASYGQLSDSADRMFSKVLPLGMDSKEFIQCFPIETRLLTDFMKSISEGVKQGDDGSELFAARKQLYEDVVKKTKEEFGLVFKEVPVWEKYPDITRFVLEKA